MFHFREQFGVIACYDGEKLLYETADLAIGYTVQSDGERGFEYTLQKHGPRELVERWLVKTKEWVIKNGFPEISPALKILTTSADRPWDIEKLNHALSTSGSIRFLVEDREAIDV